MSPDRQISPRTRKRLWTRANDCCAFPGCDKELLWPTADGSDDTILGIECHIVAQRDDPSVARAPCLLTDDELDEHSNLIEHRHGFDNLVLMCGEHSTIIDDPKQGYSVADVIAMKAAHEAKVTRERRADQAMRAAANTGRDERGSASTPLIITNLPAWEGKAIAKLATSEPATWAWLIGEVGDPPAPTLVVALINDWPDRVAQGSLDLHFALARIAEGAGEWKAATDVWERIADAHDGAPRADHLVRAAVDASAGGDDARRERLLVEAEGLDPDCPRLRVERLEDLDLSPSDQLLYLADVASDDPALGALIAAHRARAALLLPDLVQAEKHLRDAQALAPDALNVRSTSVNVRVQRARIALRDDVPSSLDEARAASAEALDLRNVLLGMRRFDESVRLLMLAADIPAIQRDGEDAAQILGQATPEELTTSDGVAVLGDAALRAGDASLARHFATYADPDDQAALRIDATARVDLGERRTEALADLRGLALASGPEALHAAFARLSACMPPVKAPWDEDVAQVLDVEGPDQPRRTLAQLRIMTLARNGDFAGAERHLAELPDEPWAAQMGLRVAGIRGNEPQLRQAAERFLEFGPDASGQLLAARALAQAGDLARAAQTLTPVTNDPNAPPRVRADAYAVLIRVLADNNEWKRAERLWEAWRRFTEGRGAIDDQLSAWQVRIAHHLRQTM